MDSNNSLHCSVFGDDFGFAFNNRHFSDRILRIEIMGRPSHSKSQDDRCGIVTDWIRHRKRKLEEYYIRTSVPDQKEISNDDQPDMDARTVAETKDKEASEMVEGALSAAVTNQSTNCSSMVRVKELHVNSCILAAKSLFFYKIFSNGRRKSKQRHVTVRVNASEEAVFMELLNFIYSNTLSVTTAPALLDVLMAADMLEVASCIQHCSNLLRSIPMTLESALLYLDLPSSVSVDEVVQPLANAAKQFLVSRYSDTSYSTSLKEVMSLTLAGVEVVLSSDDLQLASEDSVLEFALMWARAQYPVLDERQEILSGRLAQHIRFPYMSYGKLRELLTCPDFNHESVLYLVLEVLFFKAEASQRQPILAADAAALLNRWHVERAYKHKLVKVVEFELPWPNCVVYLDLKREECANLFLSGAMSSQAFYLGGKGFGLAAGCFMDRVSSSKVFGMCLWSRNESVTFAVDYDFAARLKPTEDFFSKKKGIWRFTGDVNGLDHTDLLGKPWTSFLADDSPYFINGILHIRVELAIKC